MEPCMYCGKTAAHSHTVEMLGNRILVDGKEWRPFCKPWCGEPWQVLAKMNPPPRHWSGRGAFYQYCFCTRECGDAGRTLRPEES